MTPTATTDETAVVPSPLQLKSRTHRPIQPVIENWDWQLFAACRGLDVEIFYHPSGERRHRKTQRIAQAKQICQDCPVLKECATWPLTTREPYG
ncbi:WhiB family transcriptional regulator, partial [Bacillus licheniformis]|uniref:WhiB family transcriptional regulator n=1 Tax=Bacillus licheniformis TaxID=1402 RepID=UPI0034E07B30